MEHQDNLPIGIAQEPVEEAHHPAVKEAMSQESKQNNNMIAETAKINEKCNSHYSSINEENQSEVKLTQKEHLQWLQKQRTAGLWVQCDECNRWRFLPHVLDNHELPDKWYCHINPDVTIANCSVPESQIQVRDEEDLIHGEYTAGSVVWARLSGWPWWPAMVDDDPDTEQYYWLDGFSDIPTHYNVVFFDTKEVTRAWISPEQMQPYNTNKKTFKNILENKKFKNRIQIAITQANDAVKLSLYSRLTKYSFIARYPGPINKPKKINNRDLIKYQNKIKKKYNIGNTYEKNEQYGFSVKQKNMMMGTFNKSKKGKESRIAKNYIPTDNMKAVQISIPDQVNSQEPREEGNHFIQGTVNEGAKQTESMSTEVGNTVAPLVTVGSPDNGTPKTYFPKRMSEVESILLHTMPQDFQVRIATPCSDDFEF